MHLLKLFFPTIIFLVIVDLLWIYGIAKSLYENNIGQLIRTTDGLLAPNWASAVIVYIALALGILVFALPKSDGTYLNAFSWGALFGLIVYAIYDGTNYAVLAGWPLNISIYDALWGVVLCGLTTAFAAFVQNWLNA